MIVVVDTNVWISAFHFAGGSGIPFSALRRATLIDTLAVCNEIESEVARVLHKKFHWRDDRIVAVLRGALEGAIRVNIYGTVSVCRDPDDNKILECAERARADLLVTGDKDLLVMEKHKQTRIVTPAEYLEI
jgi:putative PIN family toxin of toxin-antitoxin system